LLDATRHLAALGELGHFADVLDAAIVVGADEDAVAMTDIQRLAL
jgi:hypothetical protein